MEAGERACGVLSLALQWLSGLMKTLGPRGVLTAWYGTVALWEVQIEVSGGGARGAEAYFSSKPISVILQCLAVPQVNHIRAVNSCSVAMCNL